LGVLSTCSSFGHARAWGKQAGPRRGAEFIVAETGCKDEQARPVLHCNLLDKLNESLYYTIRLINRLDKYWSTMRGSNDTLSQTFAALANPTRRAILARLAKGEATVNELAEPFRMSLPAISKHISVLERAGLVTQGQKAQYRPCTIDVVPLKEVSVWTEHYRHMWEASFARMNDYIDQLKNREKEDE